MDIDNTPYHRKWLNNIIQELIDSGWISGEKVKASKYELKQRPQYYSGTFKSFNYDSVNILMHINEGCNRVALTTYYVILAGTINHRTGVGYYSIESLSQMAGCSIISAMKYNKILEEHKLIFFVHSRRKGMCNRYGLYKNKEKVLTAAERDAILR